MIPFYRALDALRSNRGQGTLTILQVGDSHTANDGFSNQMRTALQDRFKDAGRGFLQPGIPFRHSHPAGVQVSSEGWVAVNAFDKHADGPWGISLVRQHADGPANMTLTTDENGGLGHGSVEFLARPGGGQAVIQTDDGGRSVVSTGEPRGMEPLWLQIPATSNTHSVTVSTLGNGPVDVLGWEVGKGSQLRPEPGILYSNFGIIGSTIDILDRVDPGILAAETRRLKPSLLIVAFGTNEGFNTRTDFDTYASRYEQIVKTLHKAAPTAGLVVVLPPDGVRRERSSSALRSCRGLARGGGAFATPAALNTVRQAQKMVARRNHWMQWDWRQAMADRSHPDGRCTILTWGMRRPAEAAKDHVHLLTPGYQKTAMSLYRDLMRGYDMWSSSKKKN